MEETNPQEGLQQYTAKLWEILTTCRHPIKEKKKKKNQFSPNQSDGWSRKL